MSELHYETLGAVCARLKSGELSAVAVTTMQLERIAAHADLHAYVRVLADEALAQAEALDAARRNGASLGALHGVPIALNSGELVIDRDISARL